MQRIKKRVTLWGRFFKGKIGLRDTLVMMLPGRWRPRRSEETKFMIVACNQYHVELIKNNAVVVDAGANVGIFSIFAATEHPDATIYSFEPTRSIFEKLKENTKAYPQIKCFNIALGDVNGMATIVETNDSEGNYIGSGGVPVEMKTIDSLNIPMNFLKMDVEGYEANILKGAAETIKRYKPVIAMSAYHKPDDKKELPRILNDICPYRCELRSDYEEDFICRPKATVVKDG